MEIPDTEDREVVLIAVAAQVAWDVARGLGSSGNTRDDFKQAFDDIYKSMHTTVARTYDAAIQAGQGPN